MRIAIVTESFFPTVNGVSNSVAGVRAELIRAGHEVLIIAPGHPSRLRGHRQPTIRPESGVIRTPSVPTPLYWQIPMGLATPHTFQALKAFAPDIIHAAGPIILGAWGLRAAKRLDIPALAVFQSDLAAFAHDYYLPYADQAIWRYLRDVHALAQRTLAPSRATANQLQHHGFHQVHIWGRGVDLDTFSPAHRHDGLRRRLQTKGEIVVGYVGRLASEKNLRLLRYLNEIPGISLAIIGDGPLRRSLMKALPDATFLGYQKGQALATCYASLDIFVHTGNRETFCQTIQEAQASGVPVIAPAIGGPLDLVEHGVNGLFYRPSDGPMLARQVSWLTANPTARLHMGEAGIQRVKDRSWAALTSQLIRHYAATQVLT